MKKHFAKAFLAAVLALLTARTTFAHPTAVPLASFPADKVRGLAPLLRSTDIAIVESTPTGALKQISLFTLVAAPPAQVREVLLQAERYVDFVRNFTISKVTPRLDGAFDHFYQLSYKVFTIDGTHRYIPLGPRDATGESGDPAAPPVEVMNTEQALGSQRHYRWEFHNVGGATLLAVYGYTNVWNNGGAIARVLDRAPQVEHGLALSTQAAQVLSMKRRAQELTASPPPLPAPGGAQYESFLQRGVVILLRSQSGRLSELSIIDRSSAQPSQLLAVLRQPDSWSQFVPTITKSEGAGQRDGVNAVELEQSLPLISWKTLYGTRSFHQTFDMMGLEGDLRGARMRWEVVPGRDAPSQIISRSSQQLDRASLIIRQIYKLEPLFEYGINVGLQLVVLRSLKARAEQLVAPGPQPH